MYTKLPNLVLGFHGCDKSVYESVILQNDILKSSSNDYDWLGHGQYFRENSYERALDWATEQSKKQDSHIKNPSVIGAVIDLGYCLNLMDKLSINIVQNAYSMMKKDFELIGREMPVNKNRPNNEDLLIRNLDCAVIQYLHNYNKNHNEAGYDSIRGVFVEGNPLYENAGFRTKTHIQICVVNPNCIKGYFTPIMDKNSSYSNP
jgi:hypothetical protein